MGVSLVRVSVVDEQDLGTRHDGVGLGLAAPGSGDDGHEDHDDAERDDGGKVKPGPQHPGAVLFDLDALDVVDGQAEGEGADDGEDADEHADLVMELAGRQMENRAGERRRTKLSPPKA